MAFDVGKKYLGAAEEAEGLSYVGRTQYSKEKGSDRRSHGDGRSARRLDILAMFLPTPGVSHLPRLGLGRSYGDTNTPRAGSAFIGLSHDHLADHPHALAAALTS